MHERRLIAFSAAIEITEYGDDNTLYLAKHSMHFGSPFPSAGEGLGGEGETSLLNQFPKRSSG